MASYTGTCVMYQSWLDYAAEAANASSDTFIMGLSTSTYTPSASAHANLTDITNEVSGNGYARQTLTSISSSQTSGVYKFTSAAAVFTASGGTITARYWWIFDDTVTSPTADPLVCYGFIDQTPGDVATTNGNTLTITPNASGIYTVTIT